MTGVWLAETSLEVEGVSAVDVDVRRTKGGISGTLNKGESALLDALLSVDPVTVTDPSAAVAVEGKTNKQI